MPHQRLNPPALYRPQRPAASQVVVSRGVTTWHVAGTVGCTPERVLPDDLGEQTRLAVASLHASLAAVGATPAHVVRINLYTTDMDAFLDGPVGLVDELFAHGGRPAATLVAVPRLANPAYLVEIEATAVADPEEDATLAPAPEPPGAAHERVNPVGLYPPARNAYSQVVVTRAAEQWHISALYPLSPDGAVVGAGDLAAQAAAVMDNLGRALAAVGATPAHVVRINLYTTDMDAFRADAVATVYGFFGVHKPASTLVGVTSLGDPRCQLALEATAVATA